MTDAPDRDPLGLKHLAHLSEPIKVAIEKFSNGLGAIYRPTHIRRMAQAASDAAITRAKQDIELMALYSRARDRVQSERVRDQRNMEAIATVALNNIPQHATPMGINTDWIAHFFDRCRIISDHEMQVIWGRLLAQEATQPGCCSKRTVDVLGSMERHDTEMFATVCRFAWNIGYHVPIVLDLMEAPYASNGLTYELIAELEDLGLVSFTATEFTETLDDDPVAVLSVRYGDEVFVIKHSADTPTRGLPIGHVLFTRAGRDLLPLVPPNPVPGFVDYVLSNWRSNHIHVQPRGTPEC